MTSIALIVELHPDELVDEHREATRHAAQLKVVGRVRRALTDAGFEVLELARTRPEDAAVLRRWRRAGRPTSFGWTTTTALTHRLLIRGDSTDTHETERRALCAAESAIQGEAGHKPYSTGEEPARGRWGVTVTPHPPA